MFARGAAGAEGGRSAAGSTGAYTLIELLVVITIITTLAGLLLAGVMAARGRGGITKTKALIFRLDLAIKQYETDHGDYPAGSGGIASAESLYAALTSPKWRGQQEFTPDEVADTDGNGRPELVDHWRRPISYYHHRSYRGPPRETTFRLISCGPDGKEGTDDDITNF